MLTKSIARLPIVSLSPIMAFIAALSFMGSSHAEQQLTSTPDLPVFSVTTPSPITDYSTISNAHIEKLSKVFESLGYQLYMHLEISNATKRLFDGQRYDGAIFLEDQDQSKEGVRIEPPLEKAYLDFFCLMENRSRFDLSGIPEGTTIATTGLGKSLLNKTYPNLSLNILVANHPEHLLRLVKSGRAELGLTGRPLILSDLAKDENGNPLFTMLPDGTIERGLYLYLPEKHRELKQPLEELLQKIYFPAAKSLSNN